jgi:uncharacterized membrane protein
MFISVNTKKEFYMPRVEKSTTSKYVTDKHRVHLVSRKIRPTFLCVAIILSVICFSFYGYYIVCHLFFFLWLLYCLLFVNIIATERKTNDRQYNSHRKKKKWQTTTDNIIATERKTNDRQYNSHRKKNKWQTI